MKDFILNRVSVRRTALFVVKKEFASQTIRKAAYDAIVATAIEENLAVRFKFFITKTFITVQDHILQISFGIIAGVSSPN